VAVPAPGNSPDIGIKPMDKLTPDCIEKRTCVVCNETFEDVVPPALQREEAALLSQGKWPWGLCAEHTHLYECGVVAVVEVDLGAAGEARGPSEFPTLENLARTGRIAYLPEDALRDILQVPLHPLPPCIFVPTTIFGHFSANEARAH